MGGKSRRLGILFKFSTIGAIRRICQFPRSISISCSPVQCARGSREFGESPAQSNAARPNMYISSSAASRLLSPSLSPLLCVLPCLGWSGFTSTASGRCVTRRRVEAELVVGAMRVLESERFCAARFHPSGSHLCGAIRSPKSALASIATRALAGVAVAERSLTLEEKQLEKDNAEREAVLNYLKSQAIDISELEDIALPPSVAIMEERIAYLKKLGLTTKDINDYPLMVGCSVKKNIVPVLNYLENLNVEAKFYPQMIRKYPMVLNSSVVMDLEPVVAFLLGIGIHRSDVGRVVTRFPDLLGFKVEGTMSTSVAYLVSLGVNMRDIRFMITEYPEILGMRVGNNLKPKVDYLLYLGIPKEVLAKILEVKPFILGFDLESKMQRSIQELRDVGVREEFVTGVVVQYADVLGLNIKQRVETKMGWMRKHAGVKKEDIGRVIEKMPQILAINISVTQPRVTFFREKGFSVEDLGKMVTKCPQILSLHIDEVLKPNLDFFLKNMKRPLAELVDYPAYFTYNLEKRIRPRYAKVEENGIRCKLAWFLNCSDSKFADRLSLDFVDRTEDEEEVFSVSMGGRLLIKGESIQEPLPTDSTLEGESVQESALADSMVACSEK